MKDKLMADWIKLNKELDDILKNLTDEEWDDWYNNIDKQRKEFKYKMERERKEHIIKLRDKAVKMQHPDDIKPLLDEFEKVKNKTKKHSHASSE